MTNSKIRRLSLYFMVKSHPAYFFGIDMAPNTVVITGASSGIGLASAKGAEPVIENKA